MSPGPPRSELSRYRKRKQLSIDGTVPGVDCARAPGGYVDAPFPTAGPLPLYEGWFPADYTPHVGPMWLTGPVYEAPDALSGPDTVGALALRKFKKLNGDAVRLILNEKAEVIRRTGLLDYRDPPQGGLNLIGGDGWTGAPVDVRDDPEPVQGTLLRFQDEEWTSAAVDCNAVFCGMDVTVDGKACPKMPFVLDQAAVYSELGCRIKVRESPDLNPWHNSCKRGSYHADNVLVNFHGQVVAFDCHPVSEHHLHYLVDMTGEPTGIRLMLPARTRLVENKAFEQLEAALELEAYRYLQRRGHHRLPFKQYLRAQELGIVLPEATSAFQVGLLSTCEAPEPVEVQVPKDFPLERCYRFDPGFPGGTDVDETNAHLLAALGQFPAPFIPVSIRKEYDGYAWANLPTIGKVTLTVGKELHGACVWIGTLTCVDSLSRIVRPYVPEMFETRR